MRTIICFSLLFLTAINCIAQYEKIDSLKLLLSQSKEDTTEIKYLNKVGSVYAELKNDSALLFFNDALALSESTGDIRNQIYSRRLAAFYLYSVKSDFATAMELYLKNLKLAEETGDTSWIIGDNRDVSIIYESIEDYQKQFEYINKLREILNSGIFKDSIKVFRYRMTLYNRLGGFYSAGKMKNQDSAMIYRRKVYDAGLAINDPVFTALGCEGIANIYKDLKYSDSAVYYYHKCIPVALNIKRYDIYNECLLGLGQLYLDDNKLDSAYYYGSKVYNIFRDNRNPNNLLNAASLMADICFTKGQTDSAYFYLKEYSLLNDSIYSAEKLYKIQNLGFNESLQKQKEEQSKKEAVQEYKSKIQIYSLITGLAVLSFIVFMLYRNNRQKRIANIKIEKAYEDLKSTQSQLIQSEKMASLGELTAGIAHEIQNPLNFVNNFSEVNTELISELKDEINKGNIEEVKAIANDIEANEKKINNHGKRADAIVKGMLQHSRSRSGVKEPTDINALADEYLRLAYHGLRAKDKSFNAKMETDFEERIGNVNVVPQEIGRVILNLITNAFYAVTAKKKEETKGYEPTVTVSTKKSDDKVLITVKDNGNGIPQKIMDKIFQPFFTTKPTGQGTGLGLSLSYDIVKAHGGELKFETIEGKGSEFIIKLNI
ncbi:MAG TPA: ATP-binding protein [Ignavibacteria bacterium]|nr:ATP-binding protein [Ignavibacteria bacterium]